jgi:hypothetical protein
MGDRRDPALSGWWGFAAITTYATLCLITAVAAWAGGRPESFLALLAVPIAIASRGRPVVFTAALICGGVWLRLVYPIAGSGADQIAVGQAALNLVLAGGNPYGHGYAISTPPGAPFPYGPLMLLWAPLGVWTEIASAAATMAVIAWTRCWVTLATYAALIFAVTLGTGGGNDVTPALFVTAGLVAARRDPRLGALLVAIAAGLKPYAFAWFPGLVALGGLSGIAIMVTVTFVTWGSAVVLWGASAILRSVELAQQIHTVSENALDRPELRIIAAPVALVALLVGRWWFAVMSGVAIFAIVLFLDHWASLGYLLVIGPIVGICLERGVHAALDARRRDRPSAAAPA